MTPLEQLRVWARLAPVWQRASGAAGALLLASLVGVLLVPTEAKQADTLGAVVTGAGDETTVAGADAADAADAANATDTAHTADTVTAPAAAGRTGVTVPSSTRSTTPNAGGGCTAPKGSDQGLTATEMKVAVILINLSGAQANSLVGVPSVEEQRADYDAVVAGFNEAGGIACRKIVPAYYSANPIDQTSLQQVCLQIAQDKPFFVIDSGTFFLFPQLAACFADHQLPLVTAGLMPLTTQRAKYPYLFSGGLQEVAYRNMVFALGQIGWFSAANGFTKLGLLYRSCNAQLHDELMAWLAQVGVPSDKVVPHDAGCPPAGAPPSEMQQAVFDFQRAGVTHVLPVEDEIDFATFTNLAERQGFRPKYNLSSVQVGQVNSASHPDHDNIDGAISITYRREGEETTPGMTPTAPTARCSAMLVARGRPDAYKSPVALGPSVCVWLSMLKAGAEHAPVLARNALAAGLQASRGLDLSFPFGPADFTAPYTTYAGQTWRIAQFLKSCACWHVIDQTFHPSFR